MTDEGDIQVTVLELGQRDNVQLKAAPLTCRPRGRHC